MGAYDNNHSGTTPIGGIKTIPTGYLKIIRNGTTTIPNGPVIRLDGHLPRGPGDGDYDEHHNWHDRGWWGANRHDWVAQHHPEWAAHHEGPWSIVKSA